MKRTFVLFLMGFMALAPLIHAQSAIESIANSSVLPLRNLLIEVRQVQLQRRQSDQLSSSVQAQVVDGQPGVAANLSARRSSQDQSIAARQQVLVLNGRAATIVLSNSLPLRLTQTFVRNGVWLYVPGTVYVNANTGFIAQARWDGSSSVDLTLEATLSQGGLTGGSTSSRLMLPLDEWVTVAQSEQALNNSSTQPGGLGSSSSASQMEVQIRISLR